MSVVDAEEKVHEMVSNKRIEGIAFTKASIFEETKEQSDSDYSYLRGWDEGAVLLARSNNKQRGMDGRHFFIEVDLNKLLALNEIQFKETICFDDLIRDDRYNSSSLDEDGKLGVMTGTVSCGGWSSKVLAYAEIIEFCCHEFEKQAPCLAKLGRHKGGLHHKHEIKWEFVIDVIKMRECSIERYGEEVIGNCMVYSFMFCLGELL